MAETEPVPPRRRRLLALALIFVLAAGVGFLVVNREDDEPPPVSGTPKDVVSTIATFERAVRARDFATVCDRLFTVEAREAAGGDDCQSVLAQAAARFRTPRIRIQSIRVRGEEATATVLATVPGQRATAETIELARQGERYRIVSAGRVSDER